MSGQREATALTDAIPPAFTEHLGVQLLSALECAA